MLRKGVYLGDNMFELLQTKGNSARIFYHPAPVDLGKGDKIELDDEDLIQNEIDGRYVVRGGKDVRPFDSRTSSPKAASTAPAASDQGDGGKIE